MCFRGKVVLIVNVASYCGLTHSNYAQLKDLHNRYKQQGFAIAAFPCNQFASQVRLLIQIVIEICTVFTEIYKETVVL